MQGTLQSNVASGHISPTADNHADHITPVRPNRPCDSCRRRKSRCVIDQQSSTSCVMCNFHSQPCTYVEDAIPRKRKAIESFGDDGPPPHRRSESTDHFIRRQSDTSVRTGPWVDDYADLPGESLLKKTLGLQNHRHAKLIGLTDEHDSILLDFTQSDGDGKRGDPESFRKVGSGEYFHQFFDASQSNHPKEIEDLDQIEKIVAPHGEALIRLYFRIVHPSYPILHKKVYLEKYARTHREFSPPLLAAVYVLALNWWSYSTELVNQTKPDILLLEQLALRTLQEVSCRPKLSTVQAGLLLLQKPNRVSSWQLTCLIVGVAQDLGLNADCSRWQIPAWERGLRKRIAWALFMQDTWSALVYGRPPHVSSSNWGVTSVTSNDFPESAADEDEEDGSTEVEKGRTIFCAMITLTKLLSEVLESLYSLRAGADIQNTVDITKTVLSLAKPIQLKLKSWYADVPESLRMDSKNSKIGKLNPVGYLHLAYFAIEITLHRRIIKSLSYKTDPFMIDVCRSAAKARLLSAMDFFNRLKPEHLQSFWYFASEFNLALIGTFAGLCFVTSLSQEEAEFYQRRLQEYRWSVRVSNRSAEFLERASGILDSVAGALLKHTDDVNRRGLTFPMMQSGTEDDDSNIMDQYLIGANDGYYDATL